MCQNRPLVDDVIVKVVALSPQLSLVDRQIRQATDNILLEIKKQRNHSVPQHLKTHKEGFLKRDKYGERLQ